MTIEKKSVRVGRFVDTAHVDNVISNYKKERWVHNSKRLGKEDSLSVWYSLEELEEFIAGAKDHGADGLRVYFGAYAEDFEERPMLAGRQTIVFVATKQKDSEDPLSNKDIYVSGEKGNTILAYNMGVPCPPLCGSNGGLGIAIVDKGKEGLVVA